MTTNDDQWLPMTTIDYQWLPMTTNDYQWGNCIYWRPQHWRLVVNSEVVNPELGLYTYLFFTILGSNSSIKTASRQMLQFWTSIFSRLNCQIYSTSISSFQLCQFIFDNLASHLIESSNCLFELSKAKWVLSDLIPNHSIALLRFKICWKNFHSIPMTLVSILSGEEKLLPEPGITWIDVDFTGGEEILLPLWEGNLLTNFM